MLQLNLSEIVAHKKKLSSNVVALLCLIAGNSFFQSTVFCCFTKVVAAIHSSMDTVFFRRALATMNCKYTMYLTDISVSVCVCLRLSTAKAVWGPNSRRQIKNCVLKMFLYSAKSLHCYFSMKHRAFLISRFILFTHLKRAKPRLNYLYVAFSYHYQASLSVRAKS